MPRRRVHYLYPGDVVGHSFIGPVEPTAEMGAEPGMMWVNTAQERLYRSLEDGPLKWFPADAFYPEVLRVRIDPIAGSDQVVAGVKGVVGTQVKGTIQAVVMLARSVGNLVVDIQKTNFANYPVGPSIVGSSPPTLSAAQKYLDMALTGWDKNVTPGDIFRVEVTSGGSVGEVSFALVVKRL